MNLMEETFQTKEEKKSKTLKTIILVAIIFIVIVIIAVMAYITSIRNKQLRVYVDNAQKSELAKIFMIEEDGTIYAPIKQFAELLGYKGYNGSYVDKSEANNKCYVDTIDEIVSFELGSNRIYKLDLKSQADNYTYADFSKPVEARSSTTSTTKQSELYATADVFKKAFNISFEYNTDKNTITIFTLPYLYNFYNNTVLSWQYQGINADLPSQKAILDGALVVTATNGKQGVVDISGNTILETKYSKVTYIPEIGDFLVQDNGKVGIMAKNNKETKIPLVYDEIKLLDQDAGLYLAKKEGLYGVLDVKGNTKIYFENNEIGIDTSKFTQNGIVNKYVLAGNLIPVRRDKLWGLYNLKGEKVVDFEYDSLGYVAASSKNAFNLLVIPNYDAIVACKKNKYTLLNKYGVQLFVDAVADDIFMTIDGEGTHYYISANNQTIDAEQYLDQIGVRNMNNVTSQSNTQNNNQNTQTTQQNGQANDGQNVQQDQQNDQNVNVDQSNQQDNQPVNEEQNTQQPQQDDQQQIQPDNSGVIQSNQGVIIEQ